MKCGNFKCTVQAGIVLTQILVSLKKRGLVIDVLRCAFTQDAHMKIDSSLLNTFRKSSQSIRRQRD